MYTFLRLFGVAILVSLFHGACLYFDVYQFWPWFDAVMHFLGGVAMAFLGLELERLMAVRGPSHSIPFGMRFMAIVGFVAMIGIAWEWFEYGLDHYVEFVRQAIGMSQPSVGDTMGDLFFDLFGGSTVFFLALLFKKRKD
jgi:hypothetical protein